MVENVSIANRRDLNSYNYAIHGALSTVNIPYKCATDNVNSIFNVLSEKMDKEIDSVTFRNKKDVKRIRQCRVVFSYKPEHEDELKLNVGEVIEILGEEEEGWWRGLINNRTGVFPSNFVEEIFPSKIKSSREDLREIDNEVAVPLPPKPAKILCEVKYSYKAQNEDELNLEEGDILVLLSKDGEDPGWWKGEHNGKVGVFPDNFVEILPHQTDEKTAISRKDDKSRVSLEPHPIKPTSIALQRKSLENKADVGSEPKSVERTPPVPSKKPLIPIKKSPSNSGSGGLFSGIKKKIADAVDGATGSKSAIPKTDSVENRGESGENVFDQVERTSLILSDVRATRAKLPGRRPPTAMLYREEENCIPNGNIKPEPRSDFESENAALTSSSESDLAEVKPKVREWEKHKAPWLDEMKLNQAKRTSLSPGAENKLKKLSSTEKSVDLDEPKTPEVKKEEVPKVLPSVASKVKTPPSPVSSQAAVGSNEVEKVQLRIKPVVPTPTRPLSIPSTPPADHKPPHPKASPIIQRTPSPLQKIDRTSDPKLLEDTVPLKMYNDLLDRVQRLELIVEKQHTAHAAAIEELNGKLKLETEMRHLLQVEVDKLVSLNVMQV